MKDYKLKQRNLRASHMKKKPPDESGRMLPCLIPLTELLKLKKIGQFPGEPVGTKFSETKIY
jgi:hypothetical protein